MSVSRGLVKLAELEEAATRSTLVDFRELSPRARPPYMMVCSTKEHRELLMAVSRSLPEILSLVGAVGHFLEQPQRLDSAMVAVEVLRGRMYALGEALEKAGT